MFTQKHCWRRYFAFKPPTLPHGVAVSAERWVGRSTDQSTPLNCSHTKGCFSTAKTTLCPCHSAATGKPHLHFTTSRPQPQPTLPACHDFNTDNNFQRHPPLTSPLPTATIGDNQHLRQKGHHDLTTAKGFRLPQNRPNSTGFGNGLWKRTALH